MLTDVFVPLFSYPEETSEISLPHLVHLLAALSQNVTYCGVEVDVPPIARNWGVEMLEIPQLGHQLERRSQERATSLIQSATDATGDALACNTIRVRAAFTDPGRAVAHHARSHDITVLQVRSGSAEWLAIAEHILFGSGRPLLLVPSGESYSTGLNHMAIAWDGGATAHRALYDAMPLVIRAETVSIVVAENDKQIDEAATNSVVAYLRRHGVEPRVVAATSGERGIGLDLQYAAQSEKADMLIMGAYGHSRLREFILGGATAGALNQTIMPIFFSR